MYIYKYMYHYFYIYYYRYMGTTQCCTIVIMVSIVATCFSLQSLSLSLLSGACTNKSVNVHG